MHAGLEFSVAAVVGLACGGLVGRAVVASPAAPAPSDAAALASPGASAPVAAPGDCRAGPDPDAAVRARLAEVDQLWAFELARLHRREGRPLAWPDDPTHAPEAVEGAVAAWSASHGLAIEAIDCAEYPCIGWVAAPGSGDPSRAALEAALTEAPGIRMTRLPLEDGRISTTLAFGSVEARRDRRTRWRERSLRGDE